MTQGMSAEAALVRLSFLVHSIYSEIAARYSLTAQQAQLLCVIKDQPRGMADIARTLRLEKSSLSGLVDRGERRGLLRRTAVAEDRRAVKIEVTADGRPIVNRFYREVSARLRDVVAHLPDEERTTFVRLAAAIVAAESVPPVFGAPLTASK